MTAASSPQERHILLALDFAPLRARLQALAPVLDLAELARGGDGARVTVLVTGGMAPIDPALLDSLPALEMIALPGAGYAGVDLDDARRRGLTVTNVPAVNHEDVADVAIGLAIAMARDLLRGHRIVAEGTWKPGAVRPTTSMRARRAGILGMGSIGQAIARRLDAFGCPVAWWGPNPKDIPYPRAADLATLAAECDLLFVAAAETAATRGIVDRAILDRLGPKGILVNVSRGRLIDEDALIAALSERRIAGAGLDVFQTEPTPPDRWRGLDNVLLTPHLGGVTVESLAAMFEVLADNVALHLAGEPLPHALCGPAVPGR